MTGKIKYIISTIVILVLISSSLSVSELIGSNQIFSNDPNGDFSTGINVAVKTERNITFSKHVIDTTLDYVFGVFACDIDYDGDCDILGAAQESDEIVLYLNDGGVSINWTRIVIDDDFEGATNIFAADIDGDLDIDVVGSASYANEIAWWRNDGADSTLWNKHIIRTDFDFAHEVYCHDLDSDGDIDILGASSGFTNNSKPLSPVYPVAAKIASHP